MPIITTSRPPLGTSGFPVQREKMGNIVTGVILPAAIGALLLTAVFLGEWHVRTEARAAPLRREIAQSLAEKWGRCDLATKWDQSVPCAPR